MRIDSVYRILTEKIKNEQSEGNDAIKYSYILHLYQQICYLSIMLHKICDGTNISDHDKAYLFEKTDWAILRDDINKSPHLHQKNKAPLLHAFESLQMLAEEDKSGYMKTENNLTKQGCKRLRAVAFDFNDAIGAVCREVSDIL